MGTPSVTATKSGTKTTLTFNYLKGATGATGAQGAKGDKGDKGDTGAPGTNGSNGTSAGFGTPTATVDANVGTPSVTVTASGSNTAKVFNFAFKNLKGAKGATGATGSQGPKGDKGDTGASGKTPVKGVDYFTEADKADIINQISSSLPVVYTKEWKYITTSTFMTNQEYILFTDPWLAKWFNNNAGFRLTVTGDSATSSYWTIWDMYADNTSATYVLKKSGETTATQIAPLFSDTPLDVSYYFRITSTGQFIWKPYISNAQSVTLMYISSVISTYTISATVSI